MSDYEKLDPSIQPVFRAAESLKITSRQMLKVMDQQIEAVVSSDLDRLEQLTELNSTLMGTFRKEEKRFVEELTRRTSSPAESQYEIRIDELKKVNPGSKKLIDNWRRGLKEVMEKLKQKHLQLTELLEFAQGQNRRLMQTIYQISDANNISYGPDGESSSASPGTAVNREA